MNYLLLSIILILNIYIIYYDFRHRKIPNIILISILLISIYLKYISWVNLSYDFYYLVIWSIVAFIIYNFINVWWWDLKYIVVLWFLLGYDKIFIFLWNIWFLTLIYLIFDFFYNHISTNKNLLNISNIIKIRKYRILKSIVLFSSFFLISFITLNVLSDTLNKNITLNIPKQYLFLVYLIIFQISLSLYIFILIKKIKIYKWNKFYLFIISFFLILIYYNNFILDLISSKFAIFKLTLIYIIITKIIIFIYRYNKNIISKDNKEEIKKFPFWLVIFLWFLITMYLNDFFMQFIKNLL